MENAETALRHGSFIELRLDWVNEPREVLPLIPLLLKRKAGPKAKDTPLLQATCRRMQNGGLYRGSVADQIEILINAAAAGCRIVDLEVESALIAREQAVAVLRRDALLIVSYHDFVSMPVIDKAMRQLLRFPADYYKLVGTANRQSDNLIALDFLQSVKKRPGEQGKWIAFCMGDAGVPSRVLALSRGSAFLYASCPQKAPSLLAAPGQIDSDKLLNDYRADKLNRRTAIFGLLGNPVKHSLGAAIHNASFRAKKIDAVYLPLLASDLKDFRKAAAKYPLSGFSVTIPHKEAILRMADKADKTTLKTGAANTVRIHRGKWEAINTDIDGILVPLRHAYGLSENDTLPPDFRAVVVGTGGAARGAVIALQILRCPNIFVAGRNHAKAKKLAREKGGQAITVASLTDENFDLLIHATPVGMWPQTEESFLQADQINASTVFDLIYNPVETRLLKIARQLGCRTISGMEMFLVQAAGQFEHWTGEKAPLPLMRRVAMDELKQFQLQQQNAQR